MAEKKPFLTDTLFLEPDNHPADQAELWRDSDPDGAAIMDDLATVPGSLWVGDWTDDVTDTVDAKLDKAGTQIVTFVLYNIPNRDCGNWSAGGVADLDAYADFVQDFADGLEGRRAIVIIEPDAVPLTHCLDDDQWDERAEMLANAVSTVTAAGGLAYLDAGDSNWLPSDDIAERLLEAGVAGGQGFALNVSHTEFTENEIAYAEEIRDIVGKTAHYVVDTGRNGVGPSEDNEWCNPLGRKNGERPTLQTGVRGMDARLWVKLPGGSDGSCNGGPEAGAWWPEYARDLAE